MSNKAVDAESVAQPAVASFGECAISFILPVFNVGEYIEECVHSITDAMGDVIPYEILCWDDCSTDRSFDTLRSLSQADSHVKCWKGESNAGPSFARNRLLERARGKYIWFLDPDDMIARDAPLACLDALESCGGDMTIADFRKFTNSGDLPNDGLPFYKTAVQCEVADFGYAEDGQGNTLPSAWCSLFRAGYLTANSLCFNEDLRHYEDLDFMWRVLGSNPIIVSMHGSVAYWYRARSGSLTHSSDPSELAKYYEDTYSRIALVKKSGIWDKRKSIDDVVLLLCEASVVRLAQVPDTRYVKKELWKLKQERLYPYHFRYETLSNHESLVRRIARFLIPIEPWFWLVHYVSKARFNRARP